MRELVVGIAGAGKTRHCLARCRHALDAGREVLYLVPNRDEADLVRGRLLEGAPGAAALLPGILTPGVLARRILDRELPGWSQREPLVRRLRIRRLLMERRNRLGPLTRSAGTAGFLVALDRLFAELENGDLEAQALDALAGQAATGADRERLKALADLHAAFQAGARGEGDESLDPSAVLARAAALMESSGRAAEILPGEPLLILDGFSHLSALQLRFLRSLLPAAAGAVLSLCLDPDDLAAEAPPRPPFEGLVELGRALLADGSWTLLALSGETHRYGEGFLADLARGLFRAAPDAKRPEPGESLRLLEGATPRDEAEGLLRELRRELAAGVAPGRIALLFREPRYGELLAELLDRAGLPYGWERRQALALNPLVDLCLALLDWAAGGAAAADLLQRLRSLGGSNDPLLAALQAEARARGVPAFLSWDDFLAEARGREPEADWTCLEWRESLSDGDAPVDGEGFDAVWLQPLLALLTPPLSRSLEAALTEADAADESELAYLAADGRALSRLQTLARSLVKALPEALAPREWVELLRRAAEDDEPLHSRGTEGGGLLLGDPRNIRLPELDTVFVCGLNEGSFPPAFREDPLLRDVERHTLGGALPDWRQRQARERYLFYVACTRPSRRLWLSWSKRNLAGGPLAESQYLRALKGLCADWPEPRRLPSLALSEKLRDPVDLRSLLRDRLLAGARSEAETLAAAAETWLRKQGEGARLDAARRPREEGELAGDPALKARIDERLRLSASRLEAFAECPFRYLGQHLLGLEEDEAFLAGPREEGLLYHKVLEFFFAGEDPGEDADLEAVVAALQERALAEIAGEVPAVLSPRFRAGDARRRRVLVGFLGRDAARREASGFGPHAGSLEHRFKLEAGELPGESLPNCGDFGLGGVIDRVDIDAEGRELVLDYKRGDNATEAPDAESPSLFQLALYAIARARDGGQVAGAAYCSLKKAKPFRGYYRETIREAIAPWSVGGAKGSANGGHWLDAEAWEDWLGHVSRRLREIVGEIRGGLLAPAPRRGEDSCKNCSIRDLCRWRPGEGEEGGDV